jgi:Ser/Thr protein kinase RdoA (MazF antagonist)
VWTLLPQPPELRFAPVDLAPPLRRLHELVALPVMLPRWNPVGKARERLLHAAGLQGPYLQFMRRWATDLGLVFEEIISYLIHWCNELDGALKTTEWALPVGVIHGDAHTGNLLVDQRGSTVMCDFDSTVNGPREWDLVPAAHGPVRFGRRTDDYAAFARAYGFDVTRWTGWQTLRQIRELQLVTSVIGAVPGRPDVADQLAWRLWSILNADDSAIWQRYQ